MLDGISIEIKLLHLWNASCSSNFNEFGRCIVDKDMQFENAAYGMQVNSSFNSTDIRL